MAQRLSGGCACMCASAHSACAVCSVGCGVGACARQCPCECISAGPADLGMRWENVLGDAQSRDPADQEVISSKLVRPTRTYQGS